MAETAAGMLALIHDTERRYTYTSESDKQPAAPVHRPH